LKDKHDIARASFLEWVVAGKPRCGYVHKMCRTRAQFKLLQSCRRTTESSCCRKVTGLANKVGTAVSAQEICVMWKNRFSNLYNSVDNGDSMNSTAK